MAHCLFFFIFSILVSIFLLLGHHPLPPSTHNASQISLWFPLSRALARSPCLVVSRKARAVVTKYLDGLCHGAASLAPTARPNLVLMSRDSTRLFIMCMSKYVRMCVSERIDILSKLCASTRERKRGRDGEREEPWKETDKETNAYGHIDTHLDLMCHGLGAYTETAHSYPLCPSAACVFESCVYVNVCCNSWFVLLVLSMFLLQCVHVCVHGACVCL